MEEKGIKNKLFKESGVTYLNGEKKATEKKSIRNND